MAKDSTLTMLAIAGVGAATGGLALPALAPALAAGGAVGAAGAATTAAASSFSLMGALTGASAFLTAGSQYLAGQAEGRAQDIQKSQQILQLSAEQTTTALQEEDRQRQLRSMLSTQRAIFGASNVGSGGVSDVIAADTIGTTNRETDLKATLSRINQSQIRSGIAQSADAASAARTGGMLKAGASMLQFAGSAYDRTRT